MPAAWSNKRERQYEHIKDSARQSGKSSRRAKEIAARTVNKTRRQAGETQGRTRQRARTSGDQTKQELYARAQRLDIDGRSTMSKAELADAVAAHKRR